MVLINVEEPVEMIGGDQISQCVGHNIRGDGLCLPFVMFCVHSYGNALPMWSCGCVNAVQLMFHRPLYYTL